MPKPDPVAKAFCHFGGMTWPLPNPDLCWRLTWGRPSRSDLLVAASIIQAYGALIDLPRRTRDVRIKEIRKEIRDAR